ncbi:hypothetical protein [Klenkia terrae]|uniref:Uncharacterized protein n=1 Tax=Klenkia terrae TaxID=1052259 RepID=A0ABU8E0D1_9ACTN|nr:hypothetical protein [Klenkia terrae]
MAAAADRAGEPARHCWVAGMPGQLQDVYPAVLLAWRQDAEGRWWGRVTYSVPRDLGPAVIDTWVQAGYLTGLDPEPAPPVVKPRRFPD